jgi:hypothetical protein
LAGSDGVHGSKHESAPLTEMESRLIFAALDLGQCKVSDSPGFRPIASRKKRSCSATCLAASSEAVVEDVISHAIGRKFDAVVMFDHLGGVDWPPIEVDHKRIKGIFRIADLVTASSPKAMLKDILVTEPRKISANTLVMNALQKMSDGQHAVMGFALVLDTSEEDASEDEGADFIGLFHGETALEEMVCGEDGPEPQDSGRMSYSPAAVGKTAPASTMKILSRYTANQDEDARYLG